MATIPVYNCDGEEIDKMELNPDIFDVAIKAPLIQEAIVAQQANARRAIAHTKIRGEVRGGGKKPWKQKGTGRARHGSIRSPLWRGGAIVFGPRNTRNFSKKINKKVRKKALLMSLTQKARNQAIKVVDDLKLTEIKTKNVAKLISHLDIQNKKILLALHYGEQTVIKSARNIPTVKLIAPNSLNVLDILSAEILITTILGIKIIEQTYGTS